MMDEKAKQIWSRAAALEAMKSRTPLLWMSDGRLPAAEALESCPLTLSDVEDAEARLRRFAPLLALLFPETAEAGGLIESPLREIGGMRRFLSERYALPESGKLYLKADSHLPVAGSVKARGGIYEVLKHAETLALSAGLLRETDDYRLMASAPFRAFFARHEIHVGSTGNLGLSIGIMSAALGFGTFVHMSDDAKAWKKDLLRAKGAHVISYAGDYGAAVRSGRALAMRNPAAYFVDDENSRDLFLGYATAALRLKTQLAAAELLLDEAHPLYVYLPCGVGGAPGGIAFGLKLVFGDCAHVFLAEPVEACCMTLGLVTGLHSGICVQDIGLTGRTEADGLAVSRPSGFVGPLIAPLIEGSVTFPDGEMFPYMKALYEREGIFIEPSACAAFAGYHAVVGNFIPPAAFSPTHIAWATGGSLVPEPVRNHYLGKEI